MKLNTLLFVALLPLMSSACVDEGDTSDPDQLQCSAVEHYCDQLCFKYSRLLGSDDCDVDATTCFNVCLDALATCDEQAGEHVGFFARWFGFMNSNPPQTCTERWDFATSHTECADTGERWPSN